MSFAPVMTVIPESQTTSVIASGNFIKVYNLIVTATFFDHGTVTLKEFIGGATIATFKVKATDTFTFGGHGFLCPKGLTVTTTSNASCAIMHSNI